MKLGDIVRRKDNNPWGKAQGKISQVVDVGHEKFYFVTCEGECQNVRYMDRERFDYYRVARGINVSEELLGKLVAIVSETSANHWEVVSEATIPKKETFRDPKEGDRLLAFFSQDLKRYNPGPSGLLFP